jgi:Domain of unknown function (DUF4372)/Transposase DDE domain
MFEGKFVFAQLMAFASKYEFKKCVDRYGGNKKVRSFTCWNQFLCLCFGQLTHRESLRDIVVCLSADPSKLHHLGIQSKVSRSTFAKANEVRDWRIFADFAGVLIPEARALYAGDEEFALDLDNTVYALDATTIDLCLSVFKWARFRKNKGAVKLHTLLDLRGAIPVFIWITEGKVHEVNVLDVMEFEHGAVYVVDRGYVDFGRLYKIHEARAFFVTRAKSNFQFRRLYSQPVDKGTGLQCDQIVRPAGKNSGADYPEKLRRIKYRDNESGKLYVFLTNNFELPALTIAMLYKHRWRIELFFKWIKQHLKVKVFWGESANAVKTQVWTAICTYLLVAIIKKKMGIDNPLYTILQILSVFAMDKTPVNELLAGKGNTPEQKSSSNQLSIFDF